MKLRSSAPAHVRFCGSAGHPRIQEDVEMQGYRKMIIKGGDVTVVRGHWKADDESVTVLSAYDQLKTMYLKGSTPRGLARLMLLLMEEERGHRLPPTPEERKEAGLNAQRAIAEKQFNRMADYAARGRRFEGLSDRRSVSREKHDLLWLSSQRGHTGPDTSARSCFKSGLRPMTRWRTGQPTMWLRRPSRLTSMVSTSICTLSSCTTPA